MCMRCWPRRISGCICRSGRCCRIGARDSPGIFGILLGAPTLRLRGDYLAIVTLGFGEIIRIFLNNLNAPVNITNGPQGVNLIDPMAFGGFSFSQTHDLFGVSFPGLYTYYYLFLALALLVIFVSLRLQNSRIGRAWVAIREDEVAAEAMGINTRNIKLLAFAMGAIVRRHQRRVVRRASRVSSVRKVSICSSPSSSCA